MRPETEPQTLRPKKPRPHYTYLLVTLLLVIIWPMVFEDSLPLFGEILFSTIVVTGILAIRRRKWMLSVGTLLGIAVLVPLWAQRAWDPAHALELRSVTIVLFFIFIIGSIFVHVLRMRRVRFDTIAGSLCVYLLLGMMWAHMYLLVQILQIDLDPFTLWAGAGAPSLSDEAIRETMNTLIYFSFVTLTTLGYGDITPSTDLAQGLCILEAIVGQLYLVVMVSGLVGLHIAERVNRQGPSEPESDD